MEQMLPELEDLEERGYFSRSEIKLILRRRAYFEYLLRRKAVLKADVLRCASLLVISQSGKESRRCKPPA